MKFVCVVLSFAAAIVLSAALVRPTPQVAVVCYSDVKCHSLGGNCFCLKPKNSPEGQCICNMDPKYLNECTDDDDCIGHPDSDNGRLWCGCHRDYYLQPKGQCICRDWLG